MIKVVSFKICPFVQRVTAALEARAVAYDIEYISLSEPPEWFLQVSPNAQVPLLITESGTALFESDAIVEYLDEVYGPLQDDVTAEQHALDRAWSYQASKHYLVQCGAMSSADEDTLEQRSRNLGKAFARVEDVLGDGPYFKGDSIGNVDISWLPLLHRAAIIERYTDYDFLENYPRVKAWQASLMATGLAEKSVSSDFVESFSGYYLSQDSFLGRGKDCESTSAVGCGGSQACG